MKIWSIKGIPLTIQTITFEIVLIGLYLLIEQNAIGKPNGTPQMRVTAKIIKENTKPFAKNAVTSKKLIIYITPK